jgi:hypothetical protein
MIKSKPAIELQKFAVVDVRDSDFVVGHQCGRKKVKS